MKLQLLLHVTEMLQPSQVLHSVHEGCSDYHQVIKDSVFYYQLPGESGQ